MAKVIGSKRANTWRGVSSTCLRAIRHDPETDTLEVEFRKSGARYAYDGVTKRKADALEGASSVGKYFVRKIRDDYDYERTRGGKRSGSRKGKR